MTTRWGGVRRKRRPLRVVLRASLLWLLSALACASGTNGRAAAIAQVDEPAVPHAAVPATDDPYTAVIQPILAARCVGCHQPNETEGGLDLSTYQALLQGGDSGPALTPGAAASSRMVLMSSGQMEPKMPPEPHEGLTDLEMEQLADWIQKGALGPTSASVTMSLRTPQIQTLRQGPLPITALAISPDGQWLAWCDDEGLVLAVAELDKTERPQRRVRVLGLPRKLTAVAFLGEREVLVAGGTDGLSGETWWLDLQTVLEAHEQDGDPQINADKAVAEIPAETLVKARFAGHRDTVYSVAFGPGNQSVATAGYDRQILVWNPTSDSPVQTLQGHNGPVFALAFDPSGRYLASGSGDETVKIWDIQTGQRVETLGQPEGAIHSLHFVPKENGVSSLVAIGADQRLRVWRWQAPGQSAAATPLLTDRFVDEKPLLASALSADGRWMAIAAESGNVKWLDTERWEVQGRLTATASVPSGLVFEPHGPRLWIGQMNGDIAAQPFPSSDASGPVPSVPNPAASPVEPVFLPAVAMADLPVVDEPNTADDDSTNHTLAGPSIVRGVISRPREVDHYTFAAQAGEVWAVDVDPIGPEGQPHADHPSLQPTGDRSPLDPMVRLLDDQGQPVVRTRLQAVRESYFTFRGKDSRQTSDFRLFGWDEMGLDQWLYASGEVTRLWMHPRGPDSGFDVYPGEGQRWTYFGTSHVTHALGEPAYIVEPLKPGQSRLDNGLPVFLVYYENDDDPQRRAGSGSRLLFTAPHDGRFTIAVQDTRGLGAADFNYQLRLRPAMPDFRASVNPVKAGLMTGAGREWSVVIERFDDFMDPVQVSVQDLPPGVRVSEPVTVEAHQRQAQGCLWIEDDQDWGDSNQPQVTASATILGHSVTRQAGPLGPLQKAERTVVVPRIVLPGSDESAVAVGPAIVDDDGQATPLLRVRRGETIAAKVVVERSEGLTGEISFGNALAARNPAHGVYVDNIGLNGLLLLSGMNEREFFLTADPKTALGRRPFFLKAETDGGVTTLPIWVEVYED